MRLAVLAVLALATVVAAGVREKRQVQYQPEAASRGSAQQGQDQYAQQQQLQGFRQAAPQQQYDPSAFQQQAPRGRTTVQSFGGGLARPQQSSQQQNSQSAEEEEEEEDKPNPLTLLLEKSTFTCGGKNDGYYSDNSVQCQVFHYCVGGAKHSWMCPEGTVFHQVHLNCVPASQDICQQAEKFFFVNDYLHKELENRGPNNTILYAQRYYPDGYVLGDPFTSPSGGRSQQQHFPPQPQSPPASVPFRQSQPAQRRPQPAQFQPQQFPAAAPPQYTVQPQPQPGTAFRGAAPSAGQSGRNVGGTSPFSFPPTRTYTIPAPGAAAPAARGPEANPAYLYRQATPSQAQHSSVKYDDDY